MDEIIAEYPSTDKKKQKIPAWKQSPLFQLQQNDVDADYWKTLMDRMNARRAEGTIPKPKSLPRRRAKTALDDVLEFIKERRQDEMLPQLAPFDVEEEVYQPCERFITTSFRSTRDMATSPTRPPVTEQQHINSLSLLIRSDSNDSVKDIFEDEPNDHRTISQALQSMKPKSLPLRENSGGGHRNLEFQRTFDADVRVNEMISMVQSTPTANNRPYVKSLMSKLNIEPGGIAGRFTDIVKGAAKKRKQVPIVRGSSNDLTDDVLRAIEMPKRKNMAIGGTEPDVMFSESTFRLRKTTIYPESSQGDIKIGYPRVPRVSSPETAKLPKSLGFDDVDTRESEPKKGSMGSIFF